MTALEKLLTDYVAAAIRHKEGILSGEYKKTNRAADALAMIAVDLDGYGDVGKEALAELMSHESLAVRYWAAKDCLFLVDREAKARAILTEIARDEDMIGLNAEMVLKVWDDGELHDPWPSTQANCNCVGCRQARGEALP